MSKQYVYYSVFIPLPLQFQAAHPAFHCVPSVLGSASGGTGRSALLTRDHALSAMHNTEMRNDIAHLHLCKIWQKHNHSFSGEITTAHKVLERGTNRAGQ